MLLIDIWLYLRLKNLSPPSFGSAVTHSPLLGLQFPFPDSRFFLLDVGIHGIFGKSSPGGGGYVTFAVQNAMALESQSTEYKWNFETSDMSGWMAAHLPSGYFDVSSMNRVWMLRLRILWGLCCCPNHKNPLRTATVSKIFGRVAGGSIFVDVHIDVVVFLVLVYIGDQRNSMHIIIMRWTWLWSYIDCTWEI